MMKSAEAEALLNRLCKTARDVLEPEVDASAIEASVLARIARSCSDSLVVRRNRGQRYAWPAMVLAGVALASVAVAPRWRVGAPNATGGLEPNLSHDSGVLSGVSLSPGQSLDAAEQDLVVQHPGQATWTLRAPGRVRVVDCGRQIALALETGRIDASVIPQQRPDVFAVIVDQLRVSVHGTVFSVQRRGNEADVEVSEGSVRLESLTDGATIAGRLLTAPGRLSVNVAAPRVALQESPDAGDRAHAKTPAAGVGKPDGLVTNADPRAQASIAERPSVEEIERIWDVVSNDVADCFAARVGGDPDLHVSFDTKVGVRLLPSGAVTVAAFDPSVPESVELCAKERVQRLRTRPTQRGTLIMRPKMLVR